MTPRSWPSRHPSSLLSLSDKPPSEGLCKHTFLPSPLLSSPPSSLHLSSSCLTPAHWSLSVLNVRDTFKDAFRSPLIIHTAWIINNNSNRAIIQLYHLFLSPSRSLIPLFLSLFPLPALGHSFLPHLIPYLNLLSLCDIPFCLCGPLFQPFYVYRIFILFPLAWHFFTRSAGAFTVMDYLNMMDSHLVLMEQPVVLFFHDFPLH